MFVNRLSMIVAASFMAATAAHATITFTPGTPCVAISGEDAPCTGSTPPSAAALAADPVFNLQDPSVTNLGMFVVPGDVVLFESASGSLSDQSTWSDVVHFEDLPGVRGSTATVYPDLDPGVVLPAGFVLSANAVGIPENPVGTGGPGDFTTYTAGTNTYNIFSDSPCCEIPDIEKVPEPTTAGLLGSGLLAAILLRRRIRP